MSHINKNENIDLPKIDLSKYEDKLVTRFLNLVSTDTTSDESSSDFPSTEAQIYFAEMLASQCVEIGLTDVKVDKYCYVTATLPATTTEPTPTIGFISHIDTSPDCSGRNIKPIITENYNGEPIHLNNNITLDPAEFPALLNYKGDKIISSDGTTLLGADDKAGISEILTACEYLLENPEIKHGKIRIAFTPDEEIGRGVDYFNVENFGCDFAYTIDGGEIGEFSLETFNAAGVKIKFVGKSVHPGSAKDIMINAGLVAMEFNSLLPLNETPATTSNREGFYHLTSISGTVETAELHYIIRDFDKNSFEERKTKMKNIVSIINKKYKTTVATIEIQDQYENMYEILKLHQAITDRGLNAMKKANVTPIVEPIRGGTDGARLSFMNLPCPNIFTGGHNFHGRYEYIPVGSMLKAVEVIINISLA